MNDFTRREFLATAAAASGALPLLRSRAGVVSATRPHWPGIIDVPDAGPLELVVGAPPLVVDGQKTTRAITINGAIPGPTLRMREGQNVEIRVRNELEEDTSIHWHGLIVPPTMDGVPGVSFAGIRPGETFTYRFRVRQHGTYWYHSHSGLQEQLGHYGGLIIEPTNPEPFVHDREHVVVLSDWMFRDPYTVLKKLKQFESYFNYQRPTVANLSADAKRHGLVHSIAQRLEWDAMRMDPTDIADITGVAYTYLMNGRSPAENWTATARPGESVRLRLINAATMTYFDFRIPGLVMTVVAADGQLVSPVETDELRIAVAETYDVLVRMPDDRAYTLFAETMDRSGFARGTLAPCEGKSAPIPAGRPRPMLTMADMGMAGMHAMKPEGGMDAMSAGSPSGHGNEAPQERDATGMPGMSPHGGDHAALAAGPLPTEGLPDSVMHGPEGHGPASSMTAMMPTRRFAEPGIGLGGDGWRVLTYAHLRALRPPPDRRAPERQFDLHLTGNMRRYIWGFDGKKYSEADPIRFVYGERLRINMINDTMMEHPIHLHGMWMDLYAGGTLDTNPRKHTVSVKPGELLTVDITADAPGRWAFHCHLLYHMEMGMFRTVAVVRSLDEEVVR
ncbi:MAG: copper resistance system multicopper oxidase [Phycisphaerales bacterium]